MNNIDKLLNSLQGQQPKLDDADLLTDLVMDSLPELETEEERPRTSLVINIIRTVSSIAAMLIIGLLIYENIPTKQELPKQSMAYNQQAIISRSSTLNNAYTCCKERRDNTISYSQLKRMLYENY